MHRLQEEQKKRARKSLKNLTVLLLMGIGYLIFVRVTHKGIPCIFYWISGKYCPGCGISRMFMALAELDFAAAWRYNALVMTLLPFAAVFGIRRWIFYVKTGDTQPDLPEKIMLLIASLLTVAFWILRNTDRFSFLAPV